jgi:hypothetical protein
VYGKVHVVPQAPQLLLSVLMFVQPLPQKLGLLEFGQWQLPPPSHTLPVLVQLFPQLPQLLLSVLMFVQLVPQKFGELGFEQTQPPPEHVLPVVVQFRQPLADPQL